MDYDALENRLKELREDDHERGCEGRFYSCSCDYEPRIDQALKDSQVAIADLRARNDALVADLNERGVLIVELLAMPKANIGFAGDIHIRRARRIIDGDNDAKAQGEANYRAYCAASHDHEHEGSIDGLELIVRMIETYAADALPANKHGQIHFARGMLESAAGEIKAFLANNALAANREG